MLRLHCCTRDFSSYGSGGGYSLVMVHGLLIAVASLVEKHGLQSLRASVVAVHRPSRPETCGILPDQGWTKD